MHPPQPAEQVESPTSYDVVPYPSYSFSRAHPDQLFIVARLMGLNPAPPTTCRMLDLGCASGGHLIPLAETLPQSQFVGIDLSARQVDEGRAMIQKLGLKNIELHQGDIAKLGPELGQFDYIISHGLYSWIPPEVRDALLDVCARNLKPNGVAYVSYHTFPGCAIRASARDAMMYFARNDSEAGQRAANARSLMDFLKNAIPSIESAYAAIMKSEAERAHDYKDNVLLHDQLGEFNDPCYFHEFAARADAHGLQFLSEAEPRQSFADDLSDAVREKLRTFTKMVDREQLLDFIRYRAFRQTLMCNKSLRLATGFNPACLNGLHVGGSITAEGKVDPTNNEMGHFATGEKRRVDTADPIVKAILLQVSKTGKDRIPVDKLLPEAVKLCRGGSGNPPTPAELADAGTMLFQLYRQKSIELFARPADYATTLTDRPISRPLARHQARLTNRVTNYLHEAINLGDTGRAVIQLLDGTRDLQAVVQGIQHLMRAGSFKIDHQGVNIPVEQSEAYLTGDVKKLFQKLLDSALLARQNA